MVFQRETFHLGQKGKLHRFEILDTFADKLRARSDAKIFSAGCETDSCVIGIGVHSYSRDRTEELLFLVCENGESG